MAGTAAGRPNLPSARAAKNARATVVLQQRNKRGISGRITVVAENLGRLRAHFFIRVVQELDKEIEPGVGLRGTRTVARGDLSQTPNAVQPRERVSVIARGCLENVHAGRTLIHESEFGLLAHAHIRMGQEWRELPGRLLAPGLSEQLFGLGNGRVGVQFG